MNVSPRVYGQSLTVADHIIQREVVRTDTIEFCAVQNPVSPSSLSSELVQTDSIAAATRAKEIETETLKRLIGKDPFFMEASRVKEAADLLHCKPADLLKPLLALIIPMKLAKPPISEYYMTVVGLGKSGSIYTGVNLEFLGTTLNQAVHGEQFLIVNMRNHGETEIEAIALSADPCGHCRQFINEIAPKAPMMIQTPNKPDNNFEKLLPNAFGPQDLGVEGGLLQPQKFEESTEKDLRAKYAMEAARVSYAPYTNATSGLTIETHDGQFYSGCYLENVAYNPSLSPLQAALVALVAAGRSYEDIKGVTLVQTDTSKVNQLDATKSVLKSIGHEDLVV